MNVSYSAISSYKRCPYKARLDMMTYGELGFKPVEDYRNVAAPSVVHKAIGKMLKGIKDNAFAKEPVTEEALLKAYAAYEDKKPVIYKKLKASTLQKEGVADDRALQIKKLFNATRIMVDFAAAHRWNSKRIIPDIWITQDFESRPGYKLKGSIDIWDLDADIVYDIKVTKDPQWADPLQLQFYALLIRLKRGYMPKGGVFILPPSQKHRQIPVTFTKESVDEALHEAEKYVDSIEAQRFPAIPKDRGTCFFCPYRRACPMWGGKIVITEKEFRDKKVSIGGRFA